MFKNNSERFDKIEFVFCGWFNKVKLGNLTHRREILDKLIVWISMDPILGSHANLMIALCVALTWLALILLLFSFTAINQVSD
jgi:hypothetical protein